MIEVQEEDNYQIYRCKLNEWSNGREVDLRDGSSVTILPSYHNAFKGRNDEIHLFQSASMALKTRGNFTVRDFLSKAKILQQFVSLLFLTPQYFDGFNLRETGEECFEVKVYVRNDTSLKPHFGACLKYGIIKDKLDDIICKWFEYSEELYPIQNHLFRSLDPSKSIGNEDFLVVAQAIDGLTKTKFSFPRDYETRIKKLYKLLEGIPRLQNNKSDSKTFVKTRNYYAHMAKDGDNIYVAKGDDLITLQQQAKLLLTCALFHIYGLSDNEIDECLKHSPFMGAMFLNMRLPTD